MCKIIKDSGKRMPRKAPYGYKTKDKELIIDAQEAEEIKFVFLSILEGMNINQLSEKMGWSASTVHNRLRNPTYAGINIYGKRATNKQTFKIKKNLDTKTIVENKGSWQGIISIEDFNTVQDILDNNRNRTLNATSYNKYLLSSLLKCECGGKLIGAVSNKTRHYYRCKGCGTHIKREELEKSVINELLNTDELKILNQKIKNNIGKVQEISIKTQELKKLENRKNMLVENLIDRTITKADFTTHNNINEEKIDLLKQEIKKLNATKEERKIDTDVFNTFKEILKNINIEDREDLKNILQKMIEYILIKDKRVEEIKLRI